MTVVLWVAGVLAALAVLLGMLRVGVRLTLRGGELTADVTVGPFHVQLLPGKKKTNPTVTRDKPPAPQKSAASKPKKALPRPSLSELRSLLRTLWPPLKRALGRTRRSIRVNPFQLSVTVGGAEDPAAAAQLYGDLHGAVWAGMPVLEQLLVFKEPYVHIGIDFDAGATAAEGTLGVSVRVGTVLRMAWTVGIPGIRWLLAYRKRHMKTKMAAASAAEPVN